MNHIVSSFSRDLDRGLESPFDGNAKAIWLARLRVVGLILFVYLAAFAFALLLVSF